MAPCTKNMSTISYTGTIVDWRCLCVFIFMKKVVKEESIHLLYHLLFSSYMEMCVCVYV